MGRFMDGFKQLWRNYKRASEIKKKPNSEWTRSEFIFVENTTTDVRVRKFPDDLAYEASAGYSICIVLSAPNCRIPYSGVSHDVSAILTEHFHDSRATGVSLRLRNGDANLHQKKNLLESMGIKRTAAHNIVQYAQSLTDDPTVKSELDNFLVRIRLALLLTLLAGHEKSGVLYSAYQSIHH